VAAYISVSILELLMGLVLIAGRGGFMRRNLHVPILRKDVEFLVRD
jgi:hypothetical protein